MIQMTRALHRMIRNCDGSAAVEAAIFCPIFLLLTLGITDLGARMYTQMSVNAAAQAGAAYAVINSSTNVQSTMSAAAGDPSFCSSTGTTCTASIGVCADSSPKCVTATVSYLFHPILPEVMYAPKRPWATSSTITSTISIRVQ